MNTIQADQWDGKRAAWLWVETGDGELRPVRYIRADWWIVTGEGWATQSYCCTPGTNLYIGTPEEAKGQERILQESLKARRAEWQRGWRVNRGLGFAVP